jgi:hypothetical protein
MDHPVGGVDHRGAGIVRLAGDGGPAREGRNLHRARGGADLEEQQKVTNSLDRIDRWGKSLTVVSVILLMVVGSLWALDAWRAAYETAK